MTSISSRPDIPLLSVLVPVYNERATLAEILRRVREVPIEMEIIVVDNVSTDGTREDLRALIANNAAGEADSNHGLRIAFQSENRGKGASVRRALGLARGTWIIVQDADLEYNPRDFLRLFEAAHGSKRPLDAVFGTRLHRGTMARQKQPRTAFFYGRVGLSVVFRVLYGAPLSDVATCYKLMRRDFAQSLNLKSDGFDLDFEIAAKIARARSRGARFSEIPISYAPRTELEGKKIRVVRDGARAMWALVKFRFLP
ncbi:Glycosyltransferase involved in cell wall bisynthesis [Abditibacterium utsteinense]|uniref:Glycosyltransferase involved in cell wall bisynthesis n=1 Tax=Abditibacterium utsteinense TaxID=1960156 RepID=A0A2S8SUV5_9BACT|nr:glycosyltransferase family 2 protein [Abditibacterium utsteinense]PQV64587.1 Glycosyltransferase involved in cell wall bisynthesis [Abditibacterium utsteinense]